MVTRRQLVAGLPLVLSSTLAAACAPTRPTREAPAPRLRRGVNIHHMLNWPQHPADAPTKYVWPPFQASDYQLSPETLRSVTSAGFTFVRLTVDPAIFLAETPDRRQTLIHIVMSRVDRLLDSGLEVLLDLHPTEENPLFPPGALTARHALQDTGYPQLVVEMATALSARPPSKVALELMNEPEGRDPDAYARWRAEQQALYALARRAAPVLAIVVTGALGAPEELVHLDAAPYLGGNVIYTFHYYSPLLFTHQGMVGVRPEQYVQGLVWPPDRRQAEAVRTACLSRIAASPGLRESDRVAESAEAVRSLTAYFNERDPEAAVSRDFAKVAAWAKRQGVPPERVLLGEFGAFRRTGETLSDRASRLRWLATVREAAEASGFGWALWALKDDGSPAGSIGLVPPGGDQGLDPGMLRSLGLRATA